MNTTNKWLVILTIAIMMGPKLMMADLITDAMAKVGTAENVLDDNLWTMGSRAYASSIAGFNYVQSLMPLQTPEKCAARIAMKALADEAVAAAKLAKEQAALKAAELSREVNAAKELAKRLPSGYPGLSNINYALSRITEKLKQVPGLRLNSALTMCLGFWTLSTAREAQARTRVEAIEVEFSEAGIFEIELNDAIGRNQESFEHHSETNNTDNYFYINTQEARDAAFNELVRLQSHSDSIVETSPENEFCDEEPTCDECQDSDNDGIYDDEDVCPNDPLNDHDSDSFCADEDCDPDDTNVNPLATEVPDDGIDQDCDGTDLITIYNDPCEDVSCDDGNPCTDDYCDGGQCFADDSTCEPESECTVNVDCNDYDDTTEDYCSDGTCANVPIESE